MDDDLRVDVVYENAKDLLEVNLGQARTNLHANLECIALPRYVIFTQGFLLAFVGIGCFLLGLAVGGAITQGDSTAQPQTNSAAHLSGVVSLLKQGKRSGDAGAVVVLLPLSAAPESKGSLTGLRPGDTGEC